MYIYRYTFYFIQLLNKIVNKTYLCRSIYYTVLYKFYIISSILFKNQFKKNLNVANLPNASIGVFYFNICPMIGSVMVSYSICLRFGMNLVWGLDPLYSASAFVRGLDPCLRLYLLFSDSAYVQGVNPLNSTSEIGKGTFGEILKCHWTYWRIYFNNLRKHLFLYPNIVCYSM